MNRNSLIIIVILCGYTILCSAQEQNFNWVFGENAGISFQNGIPETFASSCDPLNTSQPASISDNNGNLVLYTDGDKVYNGNHDVIENGDLDLAPENLFVPAPGNDDLYYLFRSSSSGFFYSLIDMTMNGGNGGIAADGEDISVNSIYCQVTATLHPNGQDVWIITSDNDNGNSQNIRYKSFLLNEDGITEVDSIENYYIFAGWYDIPDDLRISPDCSRLGTTYKGHYLVLCRFDNQTGDLYDLLPSNIDLQTSFVAADLDQIEFSPNSEYLYVLGDQYLVKRYSLATWDASTIATTAYTVASNIGQGEIWTDLKLGPDGKMYLFNIQGDQLDVINLPDDAGEELEITDAAVVNLMLSKYFPNTGNFLCSNVLDISVEHQYECLGDSTEFWYNIVADPDSVYWEFGDPNSGADNFSELDSPIHVFTATGDYIVLFSYYLNGEWATIEHPVSIYNIPEIDLPDSVTACDDEPLVLDAGAGSEVYDWNTGSNSQTISVSQSGIYWVEANNGGCYASDTVDVTILEAVALDLEAVYVLCEGETLEIDLSDINADEIFWSNGINDPIIEFDSPGTYTVSASNECSASSATIDVQYVVFPQALLPEDVVACTLDPVVIGVTYDEGNIIWSNGETGPQIEITESGTYSVSVNVGDCSAEDEISVTLYDYIPLTDLEIPNIFSPDANGKNEQFRPYLVNDPDFQLCGFSGVVIDMNVYDRWGNLLTEGDCAWGGKTSAGDELAEGVYYYIIDIRTTCTSKREEQEREGYVHLVREK